MPSIPRAIHQTWQTKNHLKWVAQPQVWMTSWKTQQAWEHHLYDDADCLDFMQKSFPKLVDIYEALPTGAERADLFRYCILHEQGGLWADLDTTCMEPLHTWPVDDCSLLVGMHGVVTDSHQQAALGFVRPAQVCQWTIAAAPKHPVLASVIQAVESRVRAELKQGKALDTAPRAIFDRTGTGVWTDCVLQSLKLPNAGVRWEDILVEPFEQNETRVLPMRAFGWDKPTWGLPRSETWDRVLVRHHRMASWDPSKPGF